MKYLVVFIYIILPAIGLSQTDTGYISINGNHTSINSNKQTLLALNERNVYLNGNAELSNQESYTFISKNDSTISNDLIVKLQLRYIYHKFSIFDYLQLSSLHSRNIKLRIESAIGTSTFILNKPTLKINLSYALILFNTAYATDTLNVLGLRNSLRLQINTNYNKLKLISELYYQPLLDNISDYNYSYNVKLINPLTNHLSLTINLITTYETYNPYNLQHINKNFSIGLIYSYK